MDELAPCQSLRKIRVLGIHSSPESATMMWCVDGSVPLAPLLSSNTMFAQTVFEDFFFETDLTYTHFSGQLNLAKQP